MRSLPEKWCIPWKNRENYEIINAYFGGGWEYEDDDTHSTAWLNSDESYENPKNGKKPKRWRNYVELTIEEFKILVLKENQLQLELEPVPEDLTYLIPFFKSKGIK